MTVARFLTAISTIIILLMLGGAVMIVLRYERRLDVLEPIAQKYRSICDGVKATLRADRQLLRNIHDREVLLAKFAGSCGDDSAAMLKSCLPTPFPMGAWQRCAEQHDDNCLDGLLRTAEASIP